MLKFAFKHISVRLAKLVLIALSIVISASVALLAYNISTQVSEGIIQTAANYDIIIGPAGSATQLAMNTMFFTDKPLGTIPWSILSELEATGLVNRVVPFSMGDSFNEAPIVGTSPALLEGKALRAGEMFSAPMEVVLGDDVARSYGISVGDTILSSHGLSEGGAAHADPLTVVGILARTDTSYDTAVFTSCETIWDVHDHGDHDHDEDEHDHDEDSEEHDEHAEEEMEAEADVPQATALPSHASHAAPGTDDAAAEDPDDDHDHEAEEKTVCAVLVRTKSLSAYTAITSAYSANSDYLVINPNTVLREVLENVDMSRRIVYILCAVILVMNVFVISMIALLNAYDSRSEIQMMRLIGISMGKINLLYLIQNALIGAFALILSLLAAHLCLYGIRGFVARMGIVLNATRIYPLEWLILLVVFVLSILPTSILTLRMAGQDGIDR